MEPIIEIHTMDWREREQLRQERQLSRAKASLLERIPRQPMHTLSATLRDIEFHKTQLQQDEEKLRRREDELEQFQPTIIQMEKQKPGRYDRDPLRDNPSYHKYREYLAEKNRIESNLESANRSLEARKNRIMELEESIEEWDPGKSEERDAQMRERFLHDDEDIDTIDSANIFSKASKSHRRPYKDTRQKHESNPLSKLSNHGEGFRRKFSSLIHSFQGQPEALERMGYPMKGGRRTRKKR